MISKKIGTKKLMTRKPEIIIFIMNNTLKEKLLLVRAKKYANAINGINRYSISLLRNDDFSWHRQELRKSYSLDHKGEIIYNHPIKINDLIESIMTLLNIKSIFFCYLLFEGEVCISVNGNDFYNFLMSIFKLEGSYNASLIFTNPDRVLNINDNEYDVDIHYKNYRQAEHPL